MPHTDSRIATIAAHYGVRPTKDGLRIPCPAHNGKDANCSINPSKNGNRLLAFCHSKECKVEDIDTALRAQVGIGLTTAPASTSVNGHRPSNDAWRIATYRTADGRESPVYRRDWPKDWPGAACDWPNCKNALSHKHIWRKRGCPTRNLLLLLWEPKKPLDADLIVICEGEKAAAAVRDAGYIGASYIGGSKAVGYADFSPVEGCPVLVWPDADAPGAKAAVIAAERSFSAEAFEVRLMPVDIETDTGADAADYDVDTIRRMIDEALRLPPRETPSDAGEGIQGAPSKAVSVIRPVDDGLRAILDYLQLEVRRNARNLRIEVRRKGGGRESDRWAEQWGESPQPGGWIAFGDAIASSSHQISRKLFRFTFEERADRPAVWAERDFNEALLVCCPRAPVDPFKEWLESLPAWDGINRIDSLWIETLGMSDSELCREAGRRFLIGAVRRTYEPGAVHDWIPVLVGAQGRGKSSILRELVVSPDWFSDSTQLDGDNKQRMETTGGAVISEFSEMAGLDRADAARFKSYLSQRDDQLRPAYARYPVRLPRRWVGVGTTNPDPAGVLPGDPTGARRYVVLRSDSEGSVNELAALAEQGRAWVKKYREQLWAETVAEYRIAVKRGDTAMNLMPGHLRAAQEEAASGERRAFDGMRDVVIGLMAYGQEPERFKNGVTLAELMMQAGLSETLSDAAKDRSSQRELGTELTAAHWVKRRRQVNGVKAWRWFAPMPKDEALIPTTSEAVETIVVPVIGELDESGEWFLPWRKVLRQLLDKDVHQKAFRELLGRAIVHDDFVSLDLDFIYRTLHIYVQNEASGKGEISHLADYARLPGEDCEGCRELMRHANAPPPGQGELLPAVAPRQRVFTDPAVRKRD